MHWGSLYAETDYTSEAQILSANVLFQATPDLGLTLGGTFTHSEAAFDPIEMPETALRDEAEDIVHSSDYDYSTTYEYSDLDYDFFNVRLGAVYRLTPSFDLTFDVDYYDLTDNQGYVYGVESGSFYVVRTGFRLTRLGF